MNGSVSRRRVLVGISVLALSGLCGCKVVSIDEQARATAGGTFDASGYAQALWSEKARNFLLTQGRPVGEVLAAIEQDLERAGEAFGYRASAEGSPWTFIVHGTGRVTAKNTTSRAGTLAIAVGGSAAASQLMLQIGPVIRGNAVRDALPFVSFKDFTNQIEYAEAGKALTALALSEVTPQLDSVDVGAQVEFAGAFSIKARGDKILVTPVLLRAGGQDQ